MHPYDVLMLVILIGVTIHGAWKGVVWQIASLASIGASIYVAARFSPTIAPWFGQQEWNRFAAMLVLFLLTSLAIWLLFRLVSEFIDKVKLQNFNHQLGGIFGLGKAILFCLVITFFAVTLSETSRQAVLHARSGYFAAAIVHNAVPVLPADVRELLGKYIEQFNRGVDPNAPPVDAAGHPVREAVENAARRAAQPTPDRGGGVPAGR